MIRKIGVMLCGIVLMFSFTACKKQGPAERAGERIDETVEKTGEEMKEATTK